jgi:hypothetical protein
MPLMPVMLLSLCFPLFLVPFISDFFKKLTLVVVTASCCSLISISPIQAQNVVNLDSFDDIELQQYYLIFMQQRIIQVNSACQVLPENNCQIIELEWERRRMQLENYMMQRGVEIPVAEE